MQDKVIDLLGLQQYKNVRKIPKNMFYQQDDFAKSAEKLFTSDIDGITLIATINKSNSNIDAYVTEDIQYEEIYVMYVELRENKNIEKIIQIMHSIIPNPAIILYEHNDTITITTASKRKNKADSTKQVIEDIYSSTPIDLESTDTDAQKFITDIHIKQQSFANLWRLYNSICDRILMREVKSILWSYYTPPIDTVPVHELIHTYNDLQKQKDTLEKEYKQVVNMGDQAEIYMQMRQLGEQQKQIVASIKQYF